MVDVDANWIKSTIDEVRLGIGRNITFQTPTVTPCPLCVASGYYDITGDSTTYFTCPVCSGQYYLPTMAETEVLARIHWVNDEQITATPGGRHFLGQCYAHIEPQYLALAESTVEKGRVVVDGHNMQITKILPQGAPTLNRYRLIMIGEGEKPS